MSKQSTVTFENATPVLKSADYAKSKAFYTGILGFEIAEEGGDPAKFGIFKRGNAMIFVDSWQGGPTPVKGTWEAYIHVDDLEPLTAEIEANGGSLSTPIHETVYGMVEFEVTDPDGNVICFGKDSG